jgi:hypothetical protein
MKSTPALKTVQDQWLTWLQTNLIQGVSTEQLVQALEQREVPSSVAQSWVDSVAQSQALQALKRHTRPVRQGHRYLQLRRHLNEQRTQPAAIRETAQLSAAEFFEDYYYENRPVVMRGYANDWPARQKWTPDFIKAHYGDVTVDITDNRLSNPNYDMEHIKHTRTCTLGEFVDRVKSNQSGNDAYMVANNRAIETPDFAPILSDVHYDPEMFNADLWKGCSAFWLGPAGTITPTHHDTCNILFVQLYGRKSFKLFSPLESDMLVGARSMYADIDPEQPDYLAHPNLSSITERTATLEPGDAIFLPVGWWHHVRSLDISISFAMTNFVANNQYDWFRPGEIR